MRNVLAAEDYSADRRVDFTAGQKHDAPNTGSYIHFSIDISCIFLTYFKYFLLPLFGKDDSKMTENGGRGRRNGVAAGCLSWQNRVKGGRTWTRDPEGLLPLLREASSVLGSTRSVTRSSRP